jgi:NADH dehydrogenase FAD-containing subunit
VPAQAESALYRFAERRKVVVVGGGFSGRKVAMKLQSSFDVTLVDNKDHFMCIISLPACLCDTDHLEKVTAPHTKVRCGSRARSSLTRAKI